MTTTNTDILTNGQTAQEQDAGQAPCSADMGIQRIPDGEWYDIYEDNRDDDRFIFVLAGIYKYMSCFKDAALTQTPAEAVSTLQEVTAGIFRKHNNERPEGQQLDPPAGLTPLQLAHLAMHLRHVIVMSPEGRPGISRKACKVYAYQSDGPDKGLYTQELFPIFREFEPDCPYRKMIDARSWLRVCAKRGKCCDRKTFVAVNNGIFNCRTKKLMPFSPKYVFLSKCWTYLESENGPVMRDNACWKEPIDVWVKNAMRCRSSVGGN